MNNIESLFPSPPDESRILILEARIEALEDFISEIMPLAEAFEIDFMATFGGSSKEECTLKGYAFKRDTMHLDQYVFRRGADLIKQKKR